MPRAKPAAAPRTLEDRDFGEILERLEAVVAQLESGEPALEKSLELFEEGVLLAREGHRRIEGAERRIAALLEDGTETVLEAPADDGGDADEDDGTDDDEDDDG